MKHIILGTRDYLTDCWHDFWFWFWDKCECFAFGRIKRTYCWRCNEGEYTKEGNIRHYIQQRRMAKEKQIAIIFYINAG